MICPVFMVTSVMTDIHRYERTQFSSLPYEMLNNVCYTDTPFRDLSLLHYKKSDNIHLHAEINALGLSSLL